MFCQLHSTCPLPVARFTLQGAATLALTCCVFLLAAQVLRPIALSVPFLSAELSVGRGCGPGAPCYCRAWQGLSKGSSSAWTAVLQKEESNAGNLGRGSRYCPSLEVRAVPTEDSGARMLWGEGTAGQGLMATEGLPCLGISEDNACGLEMEARGRIQEKRSERNRAQVDDRAYGS